MTDSKRKLAILVGNQMAEQGITLQCIRNDANSNPFPIGQRALFDLLKSGRLGVHGQIKLIEYFGLKWELLIIDHKF